MAWETILYVRDGPVGVVTLNRPRALNTYNMQMRDDLHELLRCIREAGDVRALVLAGGGEKAFCAGADLSEFLTAPSIDVARRVRRLRDLWREFRALDIPVVAAVHGYVFGSGVELALSCDLRIAADNAVFGLPEMGLGILPGAGGTQLVPRAMNPAHALDMLLADRRLSAQDALARGLVTRVVPLASLRAEAVALAHRLAAAPQAVMEAARRAVKEGAELSLSQGLRLESRLAAFANLTKECIA